MAGWGGIRVAGFSLSHGWVAVGAGVGRGLAGCGGRFRTQLPSTVHNCTLLLNTSSSFTTAVLILNCTD